MERSVAFVLGLLLAMLIGHLLWGPNPWEDGVADALTHGRAVRPIDYAVTYGWWVALLNAVVAGALLLTRRRWLGPREVVENPALAPPRRGRPRWFAPLVGGAMVVTALLAGQRLPHSLWGDEEWAIRKGIDGAYVRGESDELVWDQVLWHETFFYFRRPSNHIGYSVPARFSLAAWRTVAAPETRFVSETAVRIPALLAGLAAIATVALLLRTLGFPMAGVFAAWVLAVHPWFLRYASEARGYSLLMLLCPLSLFALWRALHRGTWPRWALYAFAQFWLLWTWPPIGVFVLFLNLVAAAALGHVYGARPEGRTQWMRWALATAAAALLFLQLMAGNLVQLANYVGRDSSAGGVAWLANVGAHFVAAVNWGPDRPHYLEIGELAQASPLLFWPWLVSSTLGIAWGAARLIASGGVRALIALALLLPGPALILLAQVRGMALNTWYLIFALSSVVILLAAGLESASRLLAPRRWAGVAAAAVLATWLGAFFAFTAPVRAVLLAGSLQPMRESVALTRPSLDPLASANERILTAAIARGPSYYDPRFVFVAKPAELEALMRRADTEKLPLFLNSGRPELAARRAPELVEMVEHSGLFEEVAILYGFELRGQRRIYRYRGRDAR